ncbi:AB hydrolase superfamily protein [Apiospora saccharicola]
MPFPLTLKPKSNYVDLDAPFTPLPKHGHLTQHHEEYAAVQPVIDVMYDQIWALPDFDAFRQVGRGADAAVPPGGPDRAHDVVTELLHFPARDRHVVELKVYKSLRVRDGAALMLRMHGGGWCVGDHEADGAENVYAAARHNIVVVSVDYRLAPEHPAPQGLHDCFDALLWCKENAGKLGVNPEKIIVAGNSAGGNLVGSNILSLPRLRTGYLGTRGITGIVAQVLHFPQVCHPKFFPKDRYEFGSYIQNAHASVLNLAMDECFLDAYVPDTDSPDARKHWPLLADSHRGLPPALIQCGGNDVLRDDAFAYAEALGAAGEDVEMHAYPGLPHCFALVVPTLSETQEFYKRYDSFLDKHAG